MEPIILFFTSHGDLVLMLLPFIAFIAVIIFFILPKHPKMGIALLAGTGILAYILTNRNIKRAHTLEDKVADNNGDLQAFKIRQAERANIILANKKVIDSLLQQKSVLEKKPEKFKTELQVLETELNERQALNDRLLSDPSAYLKVGAAVAEKAKAQPKETPKTSVATVSAETVVGAIPIAEYKDAPQQNTGDAIVIKGYTLQHI
jgi:hypothetical protein